MTTLTQEQRELLYSALDDIEASVRGCGLEYAQRAADAINQLLSNSVTEKTTH